MGVPAVANDHDRTRRLVGNRRGHWAQTRAPAIAAVVASDHHNVGIRGGVQQRARGIGVGQHWFRDDFGVRRCDARELVEQAAQGSNVK